MLTVWLAFAALQASPPATSPLCKRILAPRGGKVMDLDVSPDGQRVLVGCQHGNVLVYDLASGALLTDLFVDAVPISDVEFDPTGERMLAVSPHATWVWDAKSFELQRTLREQHLSMLHASFSADGRWIATGSMGDVDDPTSPTEARIWEAATGHYTARVGDFAHCVLPVFSPQGATLVAGAQGTPALWILEMDDKRKRKELKSHSDGITRVAWHPDGKSVLSVSLDRSARLWNPETGNVLHVLSGHAEAPFLCAFSPDGAEASTTSALDRTTRVWDLKSGEQRLLLEGHAEAPTAAHFAPDGRTIASFDASGRGILFELERGKAAVKFDGHSGPVSEIAFTPDSKRVVSGSHDGTVRIWVNPRAKP